jgi:hypothetical protein
MIHAQDSTTKLLIGPSQMTNSATLTANVDCIDVDYATVTVSCSTGVNTNAVGPTIKLLTSDDTVVTNFATITATVVPTITSAANINKFLVDMRYQKRYLRLSITSATTTNDTVTVTGAVELSRKAQLPGGTAAMVATTNDTAVIV